MNRNGFIHRRAITVLKIMLAASLMLLLVACADGYTGGGAPATPVFYSPKSDQLLKVYEGENTILEVIIADDEEGKMQRQDNRGISFQWYRNEEPIDNARGPVYEIENATMAENYAVYYCTAGNTAGTSTSPKFIIQMIPVLSDPVEDIARPTPTPVPRPTPVPHAHKWVQNTRIEQQYSTENILGYKCNACDYKTESKSEMEKHIADNPGQPGHSEFEHDVIIGYFYELFTCKCGWEGFTQDEVTAHLAAEWHEIKDGVCTADGCLLTDTIHAIPAQALHTSPTDTENWRPAEVDITDTDNLIYTYICTAEECKELPKMNETEKNRHLQKPGCENHTFSDSVDGYKLMVYNCPDCYIRTKSAETLKEHFNKVPNEVIQGIPVDEEGNTFRCLACNEKFATEDVGYTHAETHKTDNSWGIENFGDYRNIDVRFDAGSKCKVCGFTSSDEDELTNHMQNTSVGVHTCDYNQVVIGTKQVHTGTVAIPLDTYYCSGCKRTR